MAITLTYSALDLAVTGELAKNNIWLDDINEVLQYNDNAIGRCQASSTLPYPEDGTYYLILKSRWGGTIKRATFKTDAGTLTVATRIDGVDVTSLSAVAVTTSEAETTATGANTFIAGQDITFVISSVSGVGKLFYNFAIDRTSVGTV